MPVGLLPVLLGVVVLVVAPLTRALRGFSACVQWIRPMVPSCSMHARTCRLLVTCMCIMCYVDICTQTQTHTHTHIHTHTYIYTHTHAHTHRQRHSSVHISTMSTASSTLTGIRDAFFQHVGFSSAERLSFAVHSSPF